MRYFWVRAEDGTVHIAGQSKSDGQWWVPGVDNSVDIEAGSVVAECQPPACDLVPTSVAEIATLSAPTVSYAGLA